MAAPPVLPAVPPALPVAADEALGLLDQLRQQLQQLDWLGLAAQWGLRLLAAVLVFAVGLWLSRKLSRMLENALRRANVDLMLCSFLRNITYFGGLIVVTVAALTQIGIPPASLLAVLGAAGLAIALALRDSLSNLASGVMLILLRPFKAGDYVQIAGQEGTIEQVQVFQTRLRTIDNRIIVLPNSQITSAPIINFTAMPRRRLDLTVGVDYDDDLTEARAALLAVAAASPRVLKDPAADVLLTSLAGSSVNLMLRAWVNTTDVVGARSELLEGIHTELRRRGLSIPYPQRDLHIYHHGETPGGKVSKRELIDDGGP
ncbi:mechanosensitive ion channel domain-containing protein [Silanimonas sp.]|uniref:mechanosensitive ion channel family protein n=1 Tax=Silanimonas sp. TaxID=1929290 RepID=UPI001BC4FC6C|nr:mechanosensitive ion channel domain-containing protein [Silanimonas sp.]MBS3896113.1 mechanosensitive ion channel [Silanimonas sp.]MBS3923837.1 mechanosensitive ion channel [Xanthomonadaceae bacterium]